MEITITLAQAQSVASAHLEGSAVLTALNPLPSSPATSSRSYLIHLESGPKYLLLLTNPSGAIKTLVQLYALVKEQSAVPIPNLHAHSTVVNIIPYYYALFSFPQSVITLDVARSEGRLSPAATVYIDLRLGSFLSQLQNIQNDFFGEPVFPPPQDPVYTWQDAFTPLLEDRLDAIHPAYSPLRVPLARAIGSFLFDDVEVPCLILTTISENDIWITNADDDNVDVAAIHPHTLLAGFWGDSLATPLLLPPGPSDAMREAYTGGAPLTMFRRQETKRLWYLVFHAAGVLIDDTKGADWANNVLKSCAEKLQDAPCY